MDYTGKSTFGGKVAIVTGASGGLGRAVAVELGRRGATVVCCARREESGTETLAQIRAAGGQGAFVRCDIAVESDVARLVGETLARHGRLDCAVNNAAIGGVRAPLTEYPTETFAEVLDTNVKGTWLCMKHQIPPMVSGGGGAIVNIAAVSGLVGVSYQASANAASKHAVVGLSRCAALEFGPAGVRVNALCPGGFDSDMTKIIYAGLPDPQRAALERAAKYPLRRVADVREIALAACWLCSDEASFLTGAAVPVDGGLTAG